MSKNNNENQIIQIENPEENLLLLPRKKKIFTRRKSSDLQKDFVCPINNCGRRYASHAAHYSHMKIQHKIDKEECSNFVNLEKQRVDILKQNSHHDTTSIEQQIQKQLINTKFFPNPIRKKIKKQKTENANNLIKVIQPTSTKIIKNTERAQEIIKHETRMKKYAEKSLDETQNQKSKLKLKVFRKIYNYYKLHHSKETNYEDYSETGIKDNKVSSELKQIKHTVKTKHNKCSVGRGKWIRNKNLKSNLLQLKIHQIQKQQKVQHQQNGLKKCTTENEEEEKDFLEINQKYIIQNIYYKLLELFQIQPLAENTTLNLEQIQNNKNAINNYFICPIQNLGSDQVNKILKSKEEKQQFIFKQTHYQKIVILLEYITERIENKYFTQLCQYIQIISKIIIFYQFKTYQEVMKNIITIQSYINQNLEFSVENVDQLSYFRQYANSKNQNKNSLLIQQILTTIIKGIYSIVF